MDKGLEELKENWLKMSGNFIKAGEGDAADAYRDCANDLEQFLRGKDQDEKIRLREIN